MAKTKKDRLITCLESKHDYFVDHANVHIWKSNKQTTVNLTIENYNDTTIKTLVTLAAFMNVEWEDVVIEGKSGGCSCGYGADDGIDVEFMNVDLDAVLERHEKNE